ncbi:hypothetical protein HY641_04225 [Candidatus Woesearchaeota archaeon]|nr:hypothetical protein [Candidatus Woesearchaeota archaeon]
MSKETYVVKRGKGNDWQLIGEDNGTICDSINTISIEDDESFGLEPKESRTFYSMYQNPSTPANRPPSSLRSTCLQTIRV